MKGFLGFGCGVALALAMTTGASAQALDKKVLSFEAALKIAAAAAAEARARGIGVVIAIVDDGGHLILLHRLGGIPIRLDGKVIGAIGVSGDTPQVDEAIAIAGASAFR